MVPNRRIGLISLLIAMGTGAANDNAVKAAFVIGVTTLNWKIIGITGYFWGHVAGFLFICPFIILAGRAAQKASTNQPREYLIKLKLYEILLAIGASVALFFESPIGLLFVLTGFGIQSAYIGPLKYSLLPKIASGTNLLSANAWMESITFVAILIGTIIGTDWIHANPPKLLAFTWITFAVIGFLSIIQFPEIVPEKQSAHVQSLPELIHEQRRDPAIMSSIWMISAFWGTGSVWLISLPQLATEHWSLSSQSVTQLMGLFVIGIAIGAGLGVAARKKPIIKRIRFGAFTLAFGSFISMYPDPLIGSSGLIITAIGGGFYALPLYNFLQENTLEVADRIAVNNVANALFISIIAVLSACVGYFKLPVAFWLFIIAIFQLFFSFYHCRNLKINIFH